MLVCLGVFHYFHHPFIFLNLSTFCMSKDRDKTICYSDMSTMLHICMHGNCMALSYNKKYGPAHWANKSL